MFQNQPRQQQKIIPQAIKDTPINVQRYQTAFQYQIMKVWWRSLARLSMGLIHKMRSHNHD
ncbi:hypothetical protein [Limnospira platensis]|uniref:hypothetical protein n=1 Tax=Limnospira platensis TaxID=118562 RepID=UPI003D6FF5AE